MTPLPLFPVSGGLLRRALSPWLHPSGEQARQAFIHVSTHPFRKDIERRLCQALF